MAKRSKVPVQRLRQMLCFTLSREGIVALDRYAKEHQCHRGQAIEKLLGVVPRHVGLQRYK